MFSLCFSLESCDKKHFANLKVSDLDMALTFAYAILSHFSESGWSLSFSLEEE